MQYVPAISTSLPSASSLSIYDVSYMPLFFSSFAKYVLCMLILIYSLCSSMRYFLQILKNNSVLYIIKKWWNGETTEEISINKYKNKTNENTRTHVGQKQNSVFKCISKSFQSYEFLIQQSSISL